MTKGFVFGKFLPFHKGHEALISFASTQCDYLTILICISEQETISGIQRKNWIEQSVYSLKNINIQCFEYNEDELANTSESSEYVSKQWADIFTILFPDYDYVITSEPYGRYVAQFMKIKAIDFDITRRNNPISATQIRNELFLNWGFLPAAVKKDLAIKVVILGTESTGKTTLTTLLSNHYNCTSVYEVGRDVIENSSDFEYKDLNTIAIKHAESIELQSTLESPLLIIDTDIHITMSYAEFIFNQPLKVSQEILRINQAHLYLYLNNDVKYVQDGSRLPEGQRNLLDKSHRQILNTHCIPYHEICGGWEDRLSQAIYLIDQLISNTILNFRK